MFHQCKFGIVDKGYQYCTICGKAHKVECNHKWKIESQTSISSLSPYTGNRNIKAYVYIQQCIYCGELKEFKTKV